MANMYPESLEGLDVKSRAEIDLFSAFSALVSDHFSVFHSVAWLGRPKPGARAVDGEADFIVLHPKMGILVLEVKGGFVGLDERSGWFSKSRDGVVYRIKDPFAQARRNKYALIQKIEDLPNWQGPIPFVGHAVAFPDGVIEGSGFGPDSPDEIIFQHKNLTDPEAWLRDCLKFWAGDNFVAPGESGTAILQRILRKSRALREPKLGEMVGVEEHSISKYTAEQFKLLDYLQGRRKIAIRGCAGSGKTMIALEKARRLADEGFRTLMTCYNRNLALELESQAKSHPDLKIRNFHSLAREYAAKTERDQRPDWDETNRRFFSDVLPDALAEAATTREDQYLFDAIIVDEGQDFEDAWWVALEMLLKDTESGIFYIFFDDNQLVYPRNLSIPVEESPFPLTINCRNTRYIHEAIRNLYRSDVTLDFLGPEGRPIEFIEYGQTATDLRASLTELLTLLVFNEKVSSRDIVVLSEGGLSRPPLREMEAPGVFSLVDHADVGANQICCTTIRLFKGLESRVVILLIPSGEIEDELLYVGISRARNHVIILHHKDIGEDIMNRLASRIA